MTLHAWTYIPTGIILGALSDLFGGDEPKGYMAASLTPEVPINGVEKFIFQFNPEHWGLTKTVNWEDITRVHMSQSRYKSTSMAQFPLSLYVFDDYDGAPEGFDNLLEVIAWFDALTMPVDELNRPPYVDLIIGGVAARLKVEQLSIEILKSYKKDDMPRQVRIELALSEAGGDEFATFGEDFTGEFKEQPALDSSGLFGDLF